MSRGDVVRGIENWYGVIVAIGQKMVTVRWENGSRSRMPRGNNSLKLVDDADVRRVVRENVAAHDQPMKIEWTGGVGGIKRAVPVTAKDESHQLSVSELLWSALKKLPGHDSFYHEIIGVAIDFSYHEVDIDAGCPFSVSCARLYHAQARRRWATAQRLLQAARFERNGKLKAQAMLFAKDIERGALVYEYCALVLGLSQFGAKI